MAILLGNVIIICRLFTENGNAFIDIFLLSQWPSICIIIFISDIYTMYAEYSNHEYIQIKEYNFELDIYVLSGITKISMIHNYYMLKYKYSINSI